MNIIYYIAYFFGGTFLANSIPHLFNGASGRKFPDIPEENRKKPESKFEKIMYSPIGNVAWGLINLIGSLAIFKFVGKFNFGTSLDTLFAGIGFCIIPFILANNIGKAQKKNKEMLK